ncbi:PREDICTED: sodium/bile acid cotransporter 4 [Propithecus coquereli]|uniref:Sodium/bile acid cotransporter 4 n=1 Tax=Propithecus coquereli TaxID=379532 RepID=A0A2K6EG85_PROCO|nr:PREDICTED: sodium/bile acid cotransporter 4 [Propithecus coquereli]
MDGTDNATLLFAPLLPDNYSLAPSAGSATPGADLPPAPASSAGPGLSLGPGPSIGFSAGAPPTPQPTTGSLAGGAASQGPSVFPRAWAHPGPVFWDTPLNHGLNVLVGAALCVTMLGLGCTVDVNRFGAHVRRPVGALLAALCQFGLLPLLAFLLALACKLDEVAAVAVLLCGCCPGGNLSNLMSLLVDGDMNLSIIMTISSTLLALVLMPLCLWIYSRAWINTPLVQLLPLGAVTLTLCSTLIPIGLGVVIRYKYNRVADYIVKVSLWSLLVTLVVLFIMTGTMLGPELLASIPAAVYMVAIFMPLAGYASGYGLATLFHLPPNCKRTVCLETGSQNVQLCTAILKLAFPPQFIGSMYMFPLLYALFQSAEAGVFVLIYKMYGNEMLHKQDPLDEDEDTDISYKKLKEEEMADTSYGTVKADNLIMMETAQTSL